jgi:hypothetical protein
MLSSTHLHISNMCQGINQWFVHMENFALQKTSNYKI